jgi:hypothetical protein
MIDVRCVHSEATWCPLQSALINVSIFWFLLGGFPCSADEHWTGWGRSGKDSYCGIYCLYAAAKVLGKDIDSRELIDPNYVGRSYFGQHAFSRQSGYIYDASVGTVDSDFDPDEEPFIPYLLSGDDTWDSSYKDSVIDDNPASSPGTPLPYSFDVQ